MADYTSKVPAYEKERLEALMDYDILDSSHEEEFDNITRLASYICQVPIALISFMDGKRQWNKSKIGIENNEKLLNISYCLYTLVEDDFYEVPNTIEDDRVKDLPAVVGDPYIHFYAAVPLKTPEGLTIGVFSVMDHVSKTLDEKQKQALSTLATEVMTHLELRKKNLGLKSIAENLTKNALSEITQELESYKSALNETAIVAVTDSKGNITYVNDSYCAISQYSREELIGKDHSLINSGYHSKEFFADMWNTLSSGAVWKNEIKNKAKDGSFYWENCAIIPFLNTEGDLYKYVAIKCDITRQKQDEIKIDQLFNLSMDFLCIGNLSGYFQQVSPTFSEVLGYTNEELLSQSVFDFIHEDDLDSAFKAFEGLANKIATISFECRFKCKDGGHKVFSWNCTPDLENDLLYANARDITDQKKAELELINSKIDAEKALATKDNFLANMSHEIRTPMNAIIGFTDLLALTELNPKQTEFVDNVKMAGENLLLIINDILDLSKLESGKLTIESLPFNLKTTLKHVYDLLNVRTIEKDLEFNLYLDADMPEIVVGDKGRINQIIMNLAGNAIKFTKEGEVNIFVKKTAETEKTVSLKFSVKDTGIGISENKLQAIFERFSQAEESTTRNFGGTGLGLNICKQLIELLNGQIQVKSTPGRGSEFYFSLEFKKADQSVIQEDAEIEATTSVLGKLSILLCEDNIINQRLATNVIQSFGFDLDIANNGQEGIDLLVKNNYDLILMDLQMPIKDGYQTTEYIREEMKSKIPIIAMTAHSLVGEKQKCMEIGMDEYVPKPFKQDDLLYKIETVFNKVPKNKDLLLKEISTEKPNLSYLKELSGNSQDFEKEMIELFIQRVAISADSLQQAIELKEYKKVKDLAHSLKSSFSLFTLEESVAILSQFEKESDAALRKITPTYSVELIDRFETFKSNLSHTMNLLNDILSTQYN